MLHRPWILFVLVCWPKCLPRPQPIFPSKTWFFWEFIWIFKRQKSLKNQYLPPHSESKSYQINSIKSCSSRSFQTTPKAHSNSSEISSEEIIQYSRTPTKQVQMSENQTNAPLIVVESFPKRPRTRSEASRFSGSHKYKQNKTKQNKLPSFIDRCVSYTNAHISLAMTSSWLLLLWWLFAI